jgi:hypothetical protein
MNAQQFLVWPTILISVWLWCSLYTLFLWSDYLPRKLRHSIAKKVFVIKLQEKKLEQLVTTYSQIISRFIIDSVTS